MIYFLAAWRGYFESRGVKVSSLTVEEYEDFKREHAAELALTTDDLRRIRERKANKG